MNLSRHLIEIVITCHTAPAGSQFIRRRARYSGPHFRRFRRVADPIRGRTFPKQYHH
jgi:hypothetical protein